MQHNSVFVAMSRRRAIGAIGTAGVGVAAAALIGCSSRGGSPDNTTNRVASVAGSTPAADGKPKSGGTLRYREPKDLDTLDPHLMTSQIPGGRLAANVYSRLFTQEPGDGKPASGKVVGDLAKSWEQPDPLTMIVHLNPAAAFDEKAPLNGRAVTSEDVVQSWKRFAKDNTYRANVANSANPDAPVETIEAIDQSTVRVKFKFPDARGLSLLVGNPVVQPVEGISGKIDLTKEMRGSGPFLLESHKAGVSLSFKRNPKWFLGGGVMPYVDGVEISILADDAQSEVQFRAKRLQYASITAPNITQFAKELSGTEIAVGGPGAQSPTLSFSYAPGQPWNDVRVRRAVSMAINRDQMADVLFSPKQFEAFGAKLTTRWNAPITGGMGAFWLDPKSTNFGPAAQYLHHNIAESQKMLAAAGYTAAKPLEFDIVYSGTTYGATWPARVEIMQAMMQSAGIKVNAVSIDHVTDYTPNYLRSKAQFKGKKAEAATHMLPGGSGGDPLSYYFAFMGSNGASSMVGKKFPEFDEMQRKQRDIIEFDARVAGMHEVNRWTTDNMAVLPVGPAVEQIDLLWKALRGPQQYRTWTDSGLFGVAGDMHLFPKYWFQEQM